MRGWVLAGLKVWEGEIIPLHYEQVCCCTLKVEAGAGVGSNEGEFWVNVDSLYKIEKKLRRSRGFARLYG